MRSSAWLVVLILAVAQAAAFAGEPVPLVNPSFEESAKADDPKADLAAGWGRWGHWINRETGWSPTRSGDCIIGYHHWEIPEKDSSGIYQDLADVPAGCDVTFSVYAYVDEKTDAEHIELRLEPKDGGKTLASQKYELRTLAPAMWQNIEVSGTTVEPGLRVLIIITPREAGPRTGAIKFDDAELLIQSPGKEVR